MRAEIEDVEQAMQDLLAMLSDPDATGIDAAWQRCVEAGQDLNVMLALAPEMPKADREEVRKGLEGLVRLNAITRQAVIHSQDGLAKNLTATKRNSEQVKAYGSGDSALGGSCDLAG